jgi:hypothetical protein
LTTQGINRLGLVEIRQRYADQQWLSAHMLSHEAAESVLDAFKRTWLASWSYCRSRLNPTRLRPTSHGG